MSTEEDFLADLIEAEDANIASRPCQVCAALDAMSETARSHVERALTGTIGQKKLAAILTKNGYRTGERAVSRHRSEGHSSS